MPYLRKGQISSPIPKLTSLELVPPKKPLPHLISQHSPCSIARYSSRAGPDYSIGGSPTQKAHSSLYSTDDSAPILLLVCSPRLLTFLPEKNIGLQGAGVHIGDSYQYIPQGGVSDFFNLLL